jgi:hypothetical protein
VIRLDVHWITEGTSRRMGHIVSSAGWERKEKKERDEETYVIEPGDALGVCPGLGI